MGKGHDSIKLKVNNFVTQFMKSRLGRGPKSVDIKITENVLIYFINGILSPMELELITTPEGEKAALEARRLYVQKSNKYRIPGIEKIIGLRAIDHYETWNLKKDTAVGIIVFEDHIDD